MTPGTQDRELTLRIVLQGDAVLEWLAANDYGRRPIGVGLGIAGMEVAAGRLEETRVELTAGDSPAFANAPTNLARLRLALELLEQSALAGAARDVRTTIGLELESRRPRGGGLLG